MRDTTVEAVLDKTFQHLETVVKERNDTCSGRTGEQPPQPKPAREDVERREDDRGS